MYKYYSYARPVAPGTFPKPEGNKVEEIHNYRERTLIPGVGMAWGWVGYEKPLCDGDVIDYELYPKLSG